MADSTYIAPLGDLSQELLAMQIDQVILYLNQKAGKKYSISTQSHRIAISTILRSGYTIEDMYMVVDYKVNEWGDSEKMKSYLTPQTLFATYRFSDYLIQAKSNRN